jgi:hypothetical protein
VFHHGETRRLSGHDDASLTGLGLVRAGAEVVAGWRPPGSQAGTGVSPVIHLPGRGIFPPRRMNA